MPASNSQIDIFEKRRKIEEKNQAEALGKLDKIGWRLEWEERFKKYLEYLGEDKEAKILDLGSGVTSSFLRLLKKKGYKNILGFDLTESASREAKKYGLKVLVGDLEKDDLEKLFKGEKFDYIIMGEVIEHLFFPQEALGKIKKILKPAGKLIISTPNAGFWLNGLLMVFFPQYLDFFSASFSSKEHHYFFTTHSFRKLLKESDFEIQEFCVMPHWLRRPVKKNLSIKLIVTFENLIYRISNLFVHIFPSIFGEIQIVKARIAKNAKNKND